MNRQRLRMSCLSRPIRLPSDDSFVNPPRPKWRRGATSVSGASDWVAPPAKLVAIDTEVHVWRVSLDLPCADVDQLSGALSQDERQRAGRFAFERDRCRFAVSRGVLRTILGRV